MSTQEFKKKIRTIVVKIDAKEIGLSNDLLHLLKIAAINLDDDALNLLAEKAIENNLDVAPCLKDLTKEIKQFKFNVLEDAFNKGKYLILSASDYGHKRARHFVKNSLLANDKSSYNKFFDLVDYASKEEEQEEEIADGFDMNDNDETVDDSITERDVEKVDESLI